MLKGMIEHRWHTLYYEHVPLWLWPAVFWQLWEIDRWSAHFGRRVFVEVESDGKVYSVWWEGMHDRWDEETHEKLSWSPGDLEQYLPNRLAKALTQSSGPRFGALSPVHALGEAQSRNPLRKAWCASTLRCAQLDWLALRKTQTCTFKDLLPLGLPLAIPIPDPPHMPQNSVFVTRPEALRASVSKRVPVRLCLPMNQVQDCSHRRELSVLGLSPQPGSSEERSNDREPATAKREAKPLSASQNKP